MLLSRKRDKRTREDVVVYEPQQHRPDRHDYQRAKTGGGSIDQSSASVIQNARPQPRHRQRDALYPDVRTDPPPQAA